MRPSVEVLPLSSGESFLVSILCFHGFSLRHRCVHLFGDAKETGTLNFV